MCFMKIMILCSVAFIRASSKLTFTLTSVKLVDELSIVLFQFLEVTKEPHEICVFFVFLSPFKQDKAAGKEAY